MTGRIVTLACLLATGALLAFSTILAKLATGVGLFPFALLAWSCLGAAGVLLGIAAARGHLPPINVHTLEYALVAATVSFAAPNALFYSAIPHVGVSFVALAIAFPPLFTYLGALALRIERFSIVRASGVALALAGAAYIAVLKLNAPSRASGWILAVLAGPILILHGLRGRFTLRMLLAVLPGLACGSPGPNEGAGGCRSLRPTRRGRA